MKIAITGSRKFEDYETLKHVLDIYAPNATCIITGGAVGADTLAAKYANEKSLELIVIRPDYQKYPVKFAPLQRNSMIVKKADMIIAFYFGQKAGGTLDTARKAVKAGKLLIEVIDRQVNISKPTTLF